MVLALLCELILIKLHANVNYDNNWNQFAFQHCRSKIKVTPAYCGVGGGERGARAFSTLSDCLILLFLNEKALLNTFKGILPLNITLTLCL